MIRRWLRAPRRVVAIGPLRILKGPALHGRAWWAIYWGSHCVSLVPRWFGYEPVWKD